MDQTVIKHILLHYARLFYIYTIDKSSKEVLATFLNIYNRVITYQ
jgi:hypothetical protein